MPRYDYECQNCHNRFEVKQSFSSDPVADCPKCSNKASRLIRSVPVVFKGSGWYVNDYGRGPNASGSSSESKESSDNKPKKSENDKGSESKPDAKIPATPDSKPNKSKKSSQ